MYITVNSRGFSLTKALHSFTHERLVLSLSRYREYVSKVDVTLSDINGPRGGVDKRCRIRVKLDNFDPIVVQDTDADLYDAITNCSARLKRTLHRKLTQQRGRRHAYDSRRYAGMVS